MSSEWGTLRADYRLPINWGLDWAGFNDTRPNSGIGGWALEDKGQNFQLFLTRTVISDGTYTDFKFYRYQGHLFAIPLQHSGLVIGPNQTEIEIFYQNVIEPCRSQPPKPQATLPLLVN